MELEHAWAIGGSKIVNATSAGHLAPGPEVNWGEWLYHMATERALL